MFPLGDDNSQRRTLPVVTYGLIGVNVLVFLLELSGGDAFINAWAFVPARFAANPGGQAITIFTAMFMHGGWMHLLGNMLFLWIFGDNVEEVLGALRYVLVYLSCGLIGSLAQIVAAPDSVIPTLGASGAIAGVMGAYIVWFPHNRVRVLVFQFLTEMPAVVVIGIWIAMQIWAGFGSFARIGGSGGVAYLAHVGGAATGIAAAFLFKGRNKAKFHYFL